MSIINFPSTLKVRNFSWSQLRLDMAFKSAFGSQSLEVSPPLWEASFEVNAMYEQHIGAWQSLLLSLKGQTNQLALWNFARPYPLGTMRGEMTLNLAAAQGAESLSIIAATEASKTLKAGDFLGVGTGSTKQVVMVMEDAVADGSGIILVNTQPSLRNALLLGASVVWDKPTALFRRKDSKSTWIYQPGLIMDGFSVVLVEDTRT